MAKKKIEEAKKEVKASKKVVKAPKAKEEVKVKKVEKCSKESCGCPVKSLFSRMMKQMASKKVSIADLAKKTKISQVRLKQVLSSHEGFANIEVSELVKIAKALEYTSIRIHIA